MRVSLKLRRISLASRDFSPLLLRYYHFDPELDDPREDVGPEYYCRDYELRYITSPKGELAIEGKSLKLKRGDILFIKPGQFVELFHPFSFYLLGIDLVQDPVRFEEEDEKGKTGLFLPDYDHRLVNDISTLVHPEKAEEFRHMFYELIRIRGIETPLTDLRVRDLLFSLLFKLHDDACKKNLRYNSPNGKMILDVMAYIDQNLEENLSLDHLSRLAGISKPYFHRLFKVHQGESPRLYIEQKRIKKAEKILISSNLSVLDIALECGFESATYFATVFFKYVNMTPTQYRRQFKVRLD